MKIPIRVNVPKPGKLKLLAVSGGVRTSVGMPYVVNEGFFSTEVEVADSCDSIEVTLIDHSQSSTRLTSINLSSALVAPPSPGPALVGSYRPQSLAVHPYARREVSPADWRLASLAKRNLEWIESSLWLLLLSSFVFLSFQMTTLLKQPVRFDPNSPIRIQVEKPS